VIAWRSRYAREGLTGQLADRPRPGRPPTVRRDRRAEILATTLTPPPQTLGVTHWSSRLLATELGVSHSTVARVWDEHDLKPWQTETFKFSTDPELEAKVRDVVGLYLDPPAHAIVVCVDEKSQIQALERTQPVQSLAPGRVERRTHDYVRHGTTTLVAALEVATGRITDACHPRHRHGEFLDFLKLVAKAYPRRQLHVVVDNYATHKHQRVQTWLARHPGSACTSPRPTPRGSTWSRCSSRSSNARPCAAATSPASRSWSTPSVGSATAGTSAASRSSGPRTPTRSSPSSSVKTLQRRTTRTPSALTGQGSLEGLPGDLQHQPEPLLDCRRTAGGHLRGGVPVVGAHGAAPLKAGAAGGLVPHHLIDDPGWDAGVFQPGREGVPKVVGATQIHGLQQRIAGRGQRPPTLLTILAGAGDEIGSDELVQGDLDRRWRQTDAARSGQPLGDTLQSAAWS
jgi:homeodomain-containing protein/DDE superfamily endonuclease